MLFFSNMWPVHVQFLQRGFNVRIDKELSGFQENVPALDVSKNQHRPARGFAGKEIPTFCRRRKFLSLWTLGMRGNLMANRRVLARFLLLVLTVFEKE